jgi:hypothetical protein
MCERQGALGTSSYDYQAVEISPLASTLCYQSAIEHIHWLIISLSGKQNKTASDFYLECGLQHKMSCRFYDNEAKNTSGETQTGQVESLL